MKTAVVTGASGFIGSHLCTRLLVDGWAVKVITRGDAPVNTEVLVGPARVPISVPFDLETFGPC